MRFRRPLEVSKYVTEFMGQSTKVVTAGRLASCGREARMRMAAIGKTGAAY